MEGKSAASSSSRYHDVSNDERLARELQAKYDSEWRGQGARSRDSSRRGDADAAEGERKYSEFAVGVPIRVAQADGTRRRAIVAIQNDDGTVDVVYTDQVETDGVTSRAEDEDNVPRSRITLLEEFEVAGVAAGEDTPGTARGSGGSSSGTQDDSPAVESPTATALRLKGAAQELFRLKDYAAAYSTYADALRSLLRNQNYAPTVGCAALIRDESSEHFRVRRGLVSIVDEGTVDIMYADESKMEGDPAEEDGVALNRVYPLPLDTLSGSAPLQCTLQLNLAVCAKKLKQFRKCIEHATYAIAIAKFSRSSRTATGVENKVRGGSAAASIDVWVKAFHLRASSHMKLHNFKRARRDAMQIMKLPGHEESTAAQKLLRDISRRKEIAGKKDKKMVRDVSRFIEHAMEESRSPIQARGERKSAALRRSRK